MNDKQSGAVRSRDRAYDEGSKAFQENRGAEANPYGADSKDGKDWEHGYLDAQKASAAAGSKSAANADGRKNG